MAIRQIHAGRHTLGSCDLTPLIPLSPSPPLPPRARLQLLGPRRLALLPRHALPVNPRRPHLAPHPKRLLHRGSACGRLVTSSSAAASQICPLLLSPLARCVPRHLVTLLPPTCGSDCGGDSGNKGLAGAGWREADKGRPARARRRLVHLRPAHMLHLRGPAGDPLRRLAEQRLVQAGGGPCASLSLLLI